jgi:sugar (pentulose or hexulose) kinase
VRPETVVFTGGAANGLLWPQILADVLGAQVRVPAVTESTALGAALYARVGAGLETSVEEAAARVVRFPRTHEPDAAAHAAYDELFGRFMQVNRRMLELSEEGLVRPLWRAAGT